MLSKSTELGGGLVCSQCGHPMDAVLRLERPSLRWKDLGSVILIGCITATALLLTVLADVVLRMASPSPQEKPGSEALRIESRSLSRSES